MKNLLIKLSLVVVMIIACNTALAVFTDSPNTYALWHCDSTNWNGSDLQTPDDNSSGRTAKNLNINAQNEATMMPNSPYGGSYLAFDGTDHATAWSVLDPVPTEYLNSEVAFNANQFPAAGKYTSILWTYPLKVYLYDGANVLILFYNAASEAKFLYSTKTIVTGTWYSVNAVVSNETLSVTVGNDTDGYQTDSMAVGAGLLDASSASYVTVGWDPFDSSGERNYNGNLDEMRIKNIPEPFTFGIIGLAGLFLIRRK